MGRKLATKMLNAESIAAISPRKSEPKWIDAETIAFCEEQVRLVELANANHALMDGTTGPVLDIIAANDVVWGVWQDPRERNGVGMMIVKGLSKLREIVATGKTQLLRQSAIGCVSADQAEALRQFVDADPVH